MHYSLYDRLHFLQSNSFAFGSTVFAVISAEMLHHSAVCIVNGNKACGALSCQALSYDLAALTLTLTI